MPQFGNPSITVRDEPTGMKTVTVSFKISGAYPNVNVTFQDQGNPNETNAAERTRFIAKAKELMTQAAAASS